MAGERKYPKIIVVGEEQEGDKLEKETLLEVLSELKKIVQRYKAELELEKQRHEKKMLELREHRKRIFKENAEKIKKIKQLTEDYKQNLHESDAEKLVERFRTFCEKLRKI